MNLWERSLEEVERKIKENGSITIDEWNKYASENGFVNGNVLMYDTAYKKWNSYKKSYWAYWSSKLKYINKGIRKVSNINKKKEIIKK